MEAVTCIKQTNLSEETNVHTADLGPAVPTLAALICGVSETLSL